MLDELADVATPKSQPSARPLGENNDLKQLPNSFQLDTSACAMAILQANLEVMALCLQSKKASKPKF